MAKKPKVKTPAAAPPPPDPTMAAGPRFALANSVNADRGSMYSGVRALMIRRSNKA